MEARLIDVLRDAVALAGGPSEMARACGVTPAAVQQWLASGRVPVERLAAAARASGVPAARLRPDLTDVLREG